VTSEFGPSFLFGPSTVLYTQSSPANEVAAKVALVHSILCRARQAPRVVIAWRASRRPLLRARRVLPVLWPAVHGQTQL
jgi:hypothetical protein